MEAAESSPPAEVSRVAVRLLPFWAERITVWFTQIEAQFFLAGVNSKKTKFFHVISKLHDRYATEVEDIIVSPPERDSYKTLSSYSGCPPREIKASASSSRSRRWATVSLPSY
jgi:hypothetical protein